MDDRQDDTGTWVGDGLRREAFFFGFGGGHLYGSLYAAASSTPPPTGAVLVNSWGFEGNQSDRTLHAIALATARAGGAGLIFHYPGFGDSPGDLAEATVEDLVGAAVEALAEGARRLPQTRWELAGTMLGASIASLAAQRAGTERLLLIQPDLRPSRYFARLERSARRAALRVPARAGNAYGYPLPRQILAAGTEVDAAVAEALGGFAGEGAVVRYAEPARDDLVPERFEDVVLPGRWRFGSRQKPALAKAATDWLQRPVLEAAG